MNENEKYENHSSEVCEKISRAIRRIARCGQSPNPARSEADPSVKDLDIQSKPEGGNQITLVLENGKGKSSTSASGANRTKSESTLRVDQESKRSGHDIEHRFSDYINRTWLKIRSMSNVGRGKNHSPKDTRHDHFGDYIARAKKKLRTTSSIGGGGGGGGRSSSSK